eukprot:scaffold47923_cov37-Tisochrysis_lutea.AAC.1
MCNTRDVLAPVEDEFGAREHQSDEVDAMCKNLSVSFWFPHHGRIDLLEAKHPMSKAKGSE